MCLENSELGAQVTQYGWALFEGKSPPLDLLGAPHGDQLGKWPHHRAANWLARAACLVLTASSGHLSMSPW